MEKEERSPSVFASRRRIRTQAEWKVDTHMVRARSRSSSATRSRISAAALFVNVIARICPGRARPVASRSAIRCGSTRVLPEPAPAMISSCPPSCTTAARCCGFRPSRRASAASDGGAWVPLSASSAAGALGRWESPPSGGEPANMGRSSNSEVMSGTSLRAGTDTGCRWPSMTKVWSRQQQRPDILAVCFSLTGSPLAGDARCPRTSRTTSDESSDRTTRGDFHAVSTIRVGSGFLRRDLFSAVTAARPGDVLVLDAGTYEVPDGFTIGNLVMTGAGERTEVVIETAFNVTGHLKMWNLPLRSTPFKTAIRVNGPRARVDLENVDVASDPTASYVGIWVDRGSLTMAGSRIWTSSSKDTPLGTSILIEAGGSVLLTGTHCGTSIVQLKRGTGTFSNSVMGCLLLEDASRVTSRDVVQVGNGADRRALMLAGESTCTLATLRATDEWTEGLVEDSLLRLGSFLPAPGAETEKVVLYTSGRGVVHAPDDIVRIVDADEPDRPQPTARPTVHTWRAGAGLEWSEIQSQLRGGDTLLLEEGEYTIPEPVVLDFDLQGKGRAGNIHLTASLSAQDGATHTVSNLTMSTLNEQNHLRLTGGSEVTLSSVHLDQRGAGAYFPVHVEGGRLIMDDCALTGRSDEDFADSVNLAEGELVANDSELGTLLVSGGGSARLSDCGLSGIFADENAVVESSGQLWHHVEPGKFACVVSAGATVDLDRRSEEHTSELQSRGQVVCRLLLEQKQTF